MIPPTQSRDGPLNERWPTGAVVKALDRDNYGHVVEDLGDKAEIHFKNPDSGHETTKTFSKSELILIPQGGDSSEKGPSVTTRSDPGGSSGRTERIQSLGPRNAYHIRRLLAGHDLNGELKEVSGPFHRLAVLMAELSLEKRQTVLDGFLCGHAKAEAIIKTLADVDPEGPPPEVDPLVRPANLADLRKAMSESQWLWNFYIPSARIVGIAAFEGIGKTRFAMDLARRIWFGLPWPDGQAATFPVGTPTLWVCADGQQDDLAAMATSFGTPDEAIHFNTFPDDPYGGNELDEEESLTRLEEFIGQVHPGLVFLDTLTNATSRDLCRANDVKDLMAPLRDIAQRTQTTIIPLLHLAKDAQALGKRIKGITRAILQLDCPDPEHPERLRLWVSKSFAKIPPALGVTMTDGGNEYDLKPPTAPASGKAGRPPEKREKAAQFIRDSLAAGNDQIGNDLCAEWEKTGGSEKTFWRAVDDMVKAGRLVKDGGTGTGKQMVLHLNRAEPEPDPGRSS